MKSVRLLPVVILAIAALLVFKTIGLVTTGGYVLGVATARAEEGAAPAEGDHAAPAEGGDAGEHGLDEPTLTDTSPTLDDGAPTVGAPADAEHGAAAGAEEAPAGEDHGTGEAAAEGEHAAEPDKTAKGVQPGTGENLHPTICPDTPLLTEDGVLTAKSDSGEAHGLETPAAEGEEPEASAEGAPATEDPNTFADTLTEPPCDPKSEGVPMSFDSSGKMVPLASEDGGSLTEQALLERLTARRTELDTYSTQLDLRKSLIDAAEKKIDDRTATLKQLQDQIGTLVDKRKELETGQFAGIVSMYENMKPKDAAVIFNDLDMKVLLQVAKTMKPRKMAPILAAMKPSRAQELTVNLASNADTPTDTLTPQNVADLPQIVGQ